MWMGFCKVQERSQTLPPRKWVVIMWNIFSQGVSINYPTWVVLAQSPSPFLVLEHQAPFLECRDKEYPFVFVSENLIICFCRSSYSTKVTKDDTRTCTATH